MILLAAVAAATPIPLQLPDATPVYCVNSDNDIIPLPIPNLGRLKAKFRTKFGLSYSARRTGAGVGTMEFRGGVRNAETISYDVAPVENGGVALLAMRVRVRGLSETHKGTQMCWRTLNFMDIDLTPTAK